ncbi:hypothetical protein D9M69_676260 [compost metagenome]
MHDDVGTECQWALQDRRGEGVVDDHAQAALVRDIADGGDVEDFQGGVGGGFHPHHSRLRRDGGLEGRQVGHVDEAEIQPCAALAHALEQPVAAAVQIVHRNDVAAAVQQLQYG